MNYVGKEIFAYPRFGPARRRSPPTFLSNCYADWLPWANDRCFILVEPWLTSSGQHYKNFPLVSGGEGR